MRYLYVIFVFVALAVQSQNSVHLFNGSGAVFKVLLNGKAVNAHPETDVCLENITQDTLLLKVDFEGRIYGLSLFLLDKGKATSGKEFTFRIEPAGNRLNLRFMGMNERRALPENLVPLRKGP